MCRHLCLVGQECGAIHRYNLAGFQPFGDFHHTGLPDAGLDDPLVRYAIRNHMIDA